MGVRRQQRVPGGRHKSVHVRATDAEYLVLQQCASQLGLTVPAYLLEVGLSSAGFSRALTDEELAIEIRAVSTELLPLRRDLYGMATNLNQLAKWANMEHAFPVDAHRACLEIGAAVAKLNALLDHAANEAGRIAGAEGGSS